MNGDLASVILSVVLLFMLGAEAPGQVGPPPDLLVLEEDQGASPTPVRYAWSGTQYTRSLFWIPPSTWTRAYGLLLDLDNETTVVEWWGSVLTLTGVGPAGETRWSVANPFPAWHTPPALDQSGELVVAVLVSPTFSVHRMDRTGRVTATITSFSPPTFVRPSWVTVDLDSGDYIVETFGPERPGGFRVTPAGQVSTLPGLELVACGYGGPLQPDYRNGRYVQNISVGYPWPNQTQGWKSVVLQPTYSEIWLWPSGNYWGGVALLGSTRVFGVKPVLPGWSQVEVAEVPSLGGPVQAYGVTPQPLRYTEVRSAPIIPGQRKLAGRGPATPGSEYEMLVNFPGEAGMSYVIGGSLGLRPGMHVRKGVYIPLSPDAVLVWSLRDAYTFGNFSGTLDQGARATGRWRIPAIGGLRGTRVFFAAVTIDGMGIRTVSDPIGVTIR